MYDEIVAVRENRPLTGGHFILAVHAPRQAKATRPGQFAMIRLLGRSDVLLRRPMSIFDVKPPKKRGARNYDATRQEVIEFLYKVVGRGTELMSALEPSDKIGLLGPLGHGFLKDDYWPDAQAADEVLHVAGGIGIAALLLPSRELAEGQVRQSLFFGGRTNADLAGFESFKSYVRATELATEDGSRGHKGFVTQPFEEYLEKRRGRKFLIMACGPWAMLRATVGIAARYGHRCLVSMENRMGCGLGVCLGCCIRVNGTGHEAYQRVCTEGPVFWADRVVWD